MLKIIKDFVNSFHGCIPNCCSKWFVRSQTTAQLRSGAYSKMAIPKKNDLKLDVPEIYRLAARKKGVFVNATAGENFGLTIVEAAACGLPVIASPTGGPKEILEHCKNGLLVDVENPGAIAEALKKIIVDQALWEKYSGNGIIAANQLYSWTSFTNRYIEVINHIFAQKNSNTFGFAKKTAW